MSNGQHRPAPLSVKRVAGVGAAALLGSLLLIPSPGNAEPGSAGGQHAAPTISEVQARLDAFDRQAEVASEAYNTVKVQMDQAAARMTGFKADLTRQRTRVAALRSEIVGTALADYTSTGGLSSSASFLLSNKPGQYIDALATTAVVEHQQASLLTQLTQRQNELGVQEQQAERALAAIAADKKQLAKQKATVERELKAAQDLLGRLKEKQRQRILALQHQRASALQRQQALALQQSQTQTQTQTTVTGTTPPSRTRPPAGYPAPSSSRAAVAVQTALAQLGKPYVWAAAGPDAFDCSGLTMYAWAAAGVSLSHSSSIQSQEGTPVSISALAPGDLVFYYSPVSHEAMYIGNGQVVHSPHTGSVVQIVPLTSMPIAYARRVG